MYISRISRQLGGFQRKGFVLPIPSRTVAGLGDYRQRNFVLPTDQLSVMPAGAVFVGTGKKAPCSACGKKPRRLGRMGQDDGEVPLITSDIPDQIPYETPVPIFTSAGFGAGTNVVINPNTGAVTSSTSPLTAAAIQAAGGIAAAGISAAFRPSASGTCPAGYSLVNGQCVAATGLSALVPGIGISYGWALGIAGGVLVLILATKK